MLKIFGDHQDNTIKQMWNCLAVGNVKQGVICADGHQGYCSHPVGGVVAYKDQISISGVGFDIACGNMAVKTSRKFSDIGDIPEIARKIHKKIDFGMGGNYSVSRNDIKDVALFDDEEAWKAADVEDLKRLAYGQLGTVGSGNHYIDLFEGDDGYVWVGVHFGSRGLGHKSATKYLNLAGGVDGVDATPTIVDADSEIGVRYLAAMHLAGRYAYAGREWVVSNVCKILGASVLDTVHNHHNFAWLEEHGGEKYWVVRKGATPAWPGQRGFVGGSMGDNAVIIHGVDTPESKEALYSTVHGSGRVMGRMEAKGKKDKNTGEWKREPKITREQMDEWMHAKGVHLVGGDVDESPMAYRRLSEVLAYQGATIVVETQLRPFLVLMAGNEVRDAYKD